MGLDVVEAGLLAEARRGSNSKLRQGGMRAWLAMMTDLDVLALALLLLFLTPTHSPLHQFPKQNVYKNVAGPKGGKQRRGMAWWSGLLQLIGGAKRGSGRGVEDCDGCGG